MLTRPCPTVAKARTFVIVSVLHSQKAEAFYVFRGLIEQRSEVADGSVLSLLIHAQPMVASMQRRHSPVFSKVRLCRLKIRKATLNFPL